MKKFLLITIFFLLFAGVVSASSVNGDYKGNPIVKITSNGKPLELDEVPPLIYDGHTVVPISLLRQLGISVIWNPETYGVDVSIPINNDYITLSKITETMRGIYAFEEQFALASIITTGIVPNVSTQDDFKTLNASLDRLNTESLTNWVNQFNSIGMNISDTNSLNDVVKDIILAKSNLKNLDSKTAANNLNNARIKFNAFAQKYDVLARDAIKLK
jgi:hypothetical protein